MKTGNVANSATVRVSPSNVEEGDVVLSRGWGSLSSAICLLDGGAYSHSGICVGFDHDKMPLIVEATKKGVVANRLEADLAAQRYIDLYRFKPDPKKTLPPPSWSLTPVINKANQYLAIGTQYAYSQLLLMGILVMVRRAPVGELGQAKIRYWLARFVKHYTALATSKEVTCSELIYRCFYEAKTTPPGKYGLTIRGTIGPGGHLIKAFSVGSIPAHMGLDPETAKVFNEAATVLRKIKPNFNPSIKQFAEKRSTIGIMAANPNVCADMVTPYDLQKSPNLEKIGEFKRKTFTSWANHVITCFFKIPRCI